MSDANNENEPTMEEILASIRKIISEDDAAGEPVDEHAGEPDAEPRAEHEDAGGHDPEARDGEAESEPLELTQMLAEDGSVVNLRPQQEAGGETASGAAGEAGEGPRDDPEAAGSAGGEENHSTFDAPGEEAAAAEAAHLLDSGGEPLVSAAPAAAVAAALTRLTESLEAASPETRRSLADTIIETLVRETLAPHLKAWLDENLPELVERVVREEVQKLAKRAEHR